MSNSGGFEKRKESDTVVGKYQDHSLNVNDTTFGKGRESHGQ